MSGILGRRGTDDPNEFEWRDSLDLDYDRVLYSSAWRRMKGVTQVAPISDGLNRSHDRMIHSLKVAQIGERTGRYLIANYPAMKGIIVPRAIKIAGMVHDLGHPPFGHVAEKELQSILERKGPWQLDDSFEGNAQTFRVITRLSRKFHKDKPPHPLGMDLTFASLSAATKYPWARGRAQIDLGPEYDKQLSAYYAKKWGMYNDDVDAWKQVLEARNSQVYDINARIMDLADDVTYAIHDVHDFFRMGLIPLHEIGLGIKLVRNAEYDSFDAYARSALMLKPEINPTPTEVLEGMKFLQKLPYPGTAYQDTSDDRDALHAFESAAMRLVQGACTIDTDGRLAIPGSYVFALEYLKELTWYYVINNPRLAASQVGQRQIIRELHSWLCDWAKESYNKDKRKTERNLRRLPARLLELIQVGRDDNRSISRAVVDFIASLTDAEATHLHHNLGGGVAVVAPVSWL